MFQGSLTALLVLSIALGCYVYPYSLAIQFFLTMLLALPCLFMIIFLAYDKVRQTFYPTEEEKRRLKEWERNVKRGARAAAEVHGDVVCIMCSHGTWCSGTP